MNMKLYVWTAKTHGPMSFFVMAESEEQAKEYVDKYIATISQEDGYTEYYYDGWGTDYYVLTVYEQGQVVDHENA